MGSGTRSFAEPILAINDLTSGNVTMLPMSNTAALRALQSGEVGAAIFVDGARNQAVWTALHDPNLKLLSYGHAEAYRRTFPYISKLTLPPGIIDIAHNIPAKEVALIGTKEMLAARDGLHPALIDLLVDAAREIHGQQGLFEEAGEFPGTTQVDLRVSSEADQHKHFGSRFLYQYLPFWVATIAERAIIILLPLAATYFRSSTTCHSSYAGGYARVSIAGTVSCSAGARCRHAHRCAAYGEMAGGPGPYRAFRRANPHTGRFRQ